jgi:class 3 adenylate cyclase
LVVPFYMDRHEFAGVSAADVARAHQMDLEIQDKFGVDFLNYWFDAERQHAFCLAKGPSREAVDAVHRESHGMVAYQVIEVDQAAVERFMGGIVNHKPGEAFVETAFRTILFTDIEGSTSLTQRLGDTAAMAVLRIHDRVVRESLARNGGSEVKHTGDGLMAAFPSVVGGIASAIEIQRGLREAAVNEGVPLRVRIGLSAGEPVTERDDLFGAAVQLAARLCQRAEPGTILVSSGVHDLALGKGFAYGRGKRLRLKGFEEPINAFEVDWQAQPEPPRPEISGDVA